MPDTPTVTDRQDQSRFLYTEDGADAQLVYRVDGDHLYLIHTEVPDALGGRGIGSMLVRAAVDRAASSGETVHPWCPYARAWLEKHPDDAGRVTIDWTAPSS